MVRIITFSHYLAHTDPLFLSLSILPLDKLFLYKIVIIMYKYCNGLLTGVMNRLYVKKYVIHAYYPRGNNLLTIPRGTANFTNISARIWNVLDINIKVYIPYRAFKHNIEIYLLNNSSGLIYSK